MKPIALVIALSAVGWLSAASAQDTAGNEAAPAAPNPAPVITAPPANTISPENVTAPPAVETPPPRPTEAPAPPPPPPPPGPVRSPIAILRVLDKVTAETLRFEAPVGRRVRYKSLIFTVKACETRGVKDPLPRPSAYVVVDSEPAALPGEAAPEAKEIYRGWMFANAPDLHLFQHPVYDAWLESCVDGPPPV